MKRELFYLSLAAAGFTHPSAVSAGEKPKQKPNVIIVFADDLGWAELGCYGNTFNETPALDSLARCGVRFTDAYASAPISSPSRAGLISGRYPLRDGITDYIKPNSPIHPAPRSPRHCAATATARESSANGTSRDTGPTEPPSNGIPTNTDSRR